MNEEIFDKDLRRFLKKVGITSQQQVEAAVATALAKGTLQGADPLQISVRLEAPALGLAETITGEIRLEGASPDP